MSKMNSLQPIVWTNHEIEDLKHQIECTNSHLREITKAIENLSKVIDNTWFNLMCASLAYAVGSWFCSQIKLV